MTLPCRAAELHGASGLIYCRSAVEGFVRCSYGREGIRVDICVDIRADIRVDVRTGVRTGVRADVRVCRAFLVY